MARLLGLDLGSATLKGVVIESSLRGMQVVGYVEAAVGEGDKATRLADALSRLVPKLAGTRVDQVAISLPGSAIPTHVVTLPFVDAKRIEATLPFEVEGQLPFDLADAAYDYQTSPNSQGQSNIVVGITRKEELAELLAVLKTHSLEPRIVTHPGLVFQNFLPLIARELNLNDADESFAVVDLGHERTCVAVAHGQNVEFSRVFPGGGLGLTRALAKEFGITEPDAQGWKEQHGALGSHAVGPEAQRAAAAFAKGLSPAVREIRLSLKAAEARSQRKIGRVFLTGGTSGLLGIAEFMTEQLGIPCAMLPIPPEGEPALAGHRNTGAHAYALAIRANASGAKAPRFNLRRGAFAFKGDLDFVRDRLPQLATFGVLLLLLLITSGVVRNIVLERREKQLDQMLCEITQRVLGTCEKNFDKALNLMQGKGSPAAALPQFSAVNVVGEVLAHVPDSVSLKVEQAVIDLDRVSMKCEVGSPKQVDELETALKAYRCFKEIKSGKLEKSKDGTKVSFRLEVQVECPDETGGEG